MELLQRWLENTWLLALDSAPWLLVGLIAAGLIRAWIPMKLVARMLGGSGSASVIKAALIGAPLPLCSCSVLPAAISLRRGGASKASTTSFLIATPETGVDSVALSWVLLGPWLAIIRPIAAVLSAVTAGLLVGRFDTPKPAHTIELPVAQPDSSMSAASPPIRCADGACGCVAQTPPQGRGDAATASEPSRAHARGARGSFVSRTWEGLQYAFTTLLDDLSLWLAAAILAAGAVITLLPAETLAAWGSGLFAMLAILAISVPMYVCATASTPLAHAMLFAGVSPGTVLVFLLAGPASNIGSLAIIRRELGNRALGAYLVGVAGMSLLLGLALDQAIATLDWRIFSVVETASRESENNVLAIFSLLFLITAAIPPLRRRLTPGKGDKEGGCRG